MEFAYLSKKVAIPNDVQVRVVAWSSEGEWIACGGDGGLLKVFRLEPPKDGDPKRTTNLSMNQNLEGHEAAVTCAAWNEPYRKLTTSDDSGLIIVWTLRNGVFVEEMINNREESAVAEMKWSSDGQKICIAYEDGNVIVGSVDGSRYWGKDLPISPLLKVEWSPDSRSLLFGTGNSEVHIYDAHTGTSTGLVSTGADLDKGDNAKLVALAWYDGSEGYLLGSNQYSLALVYESGRFQLLQHAEDVEGSSFDSGLRVSDAKWSPNGSILAISGALFDSAGVVGGVDKHFGVIQLWDAKGNNLRTIRVHGSGVRSLSWEGRGLRIGMAVDASIYFANIRVSYMWACLKKTYVYAFPNIATGEHTVMFWKEKSGEKYIKPGFFSLAHLCSNREDRVLLVHRGMKENRDIRDYASRHPHVDFWTLTVCDTIGSPVNSRVVDIEPKMACMSGTHVYVSDGNYCYVWQYRSRHHVERMESALAVNGAVELASSEAEQLFYIDDGPAQSLSRCPAGTNISAVTSKRRFEQRCSSDPIASMEAHDDRLVLARSSGEVLLYAVAASGTFAFHSRFNTTAYGMDGKGKRTTSGSQALPKHIQLNCTKDRLAVIDAAGSLSVWETSEVRSDDSEKRKHATLSSSLPSWQQVPGISKRDCWQCCWAEDNSNALAVMEKTRLCVLRDGEQDDMVVTNAYIGRFKNLKIKGMLLDDLMLEPALPSRQMVVEVETVVLQEMREKVSNCNGNLREVYEYVNQHPHKQLWRILAEAALESFQFTIAEQAFVRSQDYQGIHFVKQLRQLNDENLKKAEVSAYFKRYDEAEKIYRDIDRKDLAVDLRSRLGDWYRVIQLVQEGGGDDTLIAHAWEQLGEQYAEKRRWDKAAQYFQQAKRYRKLVDALWHGRDFERITSLIREIPDQTDLLVDIGRKLVNEGRFTGAIQAYIQAGHVRSAVDVCIDAGDWLQAKALAVEYGLPAAEIDGAVQKLSDSLESEAQYVLLLQAAGRNKEAASLLFKWCDKEIKRGSNLLLAKRLAVLGAKLWTRKSSVGAVNRSRSSSSTANKTVTEGMRQTLDDLLETDSLVGGGKSLTTGGSGVVNPWRRAEALHILLRCQQAMLEEADCEAVPSTSRWVGHVRPGDSAILSRMLLAYVDILGSRKVHDLIALSTMRCEMYGDCSKALAVLKGLPAVNGTDAETGEGRSATLDKLAVQLFSAHGPRNRDPETEMDWTKFIESYDPFRTCLMTGTSDNSDMWKCEACHHHFSAASVQRYKNCPLCHHPRNTQ